MKITVRQLRNIIHEKLGKDQKRKRPGMKHFYRNALGDLYNVNDITKIIEDGKYVDPYLFDLVYSLFWRANETHNYVEKLSQIYNNLKKSGSQQELRDLHDQIKRFVTNALENMIFSPEKIKTEKLPNSLSSKNIPTLPSLKSRLKKIIVSRNVKEFDEFVMTIEKIDPNISSGGWYDDARDYMGGHTYIDNKRDFLKNILEDFEFSFS